MLCTKSYGKRRKSRPDGRPSRAGRQERDARVRRRGGRGGDGGLGVRRNFLQLRPSVQASLGRLGEENSGSCCRTGLQGVSWLEGGPRLAFGARSGRVWGQGVTVYACKYSPSSGVVYNAPMLPFGHGSLYTDGGRIAVDVDVQGRPGWQTFRFHQPGGEGWGRGGQGSEVPVGFS